MKMRWIEKALSWISPEAAARRTMVLDQMRSYDAARTDRFGKGWTATNRPAELTDRAYRDRVRARARDLERNSDPMRAIIDAYNRNVVGTGIRVQSLAGVDKTLRREIETAWARWCRARNCDVTKQSSFYEMQEMIVQRFIVDGEILVVKTYGGSGRIPFQLQLHEVDDLDNWTTEYQGNRVYGGIEVDENLAPVAYHFRQLTPNGLQSLKSIRIEAERVIHLYGKNRPSQLRGMSRFASSINRVNNVDEYLEAETVKARIAACLGVFVRQQGAAPSIGRGATPAIDPKTGARQETIAPGMISYLQPGEDVSVISPGGVPTTLAEFVRTQQRLAGAGNGLSYETASRDYSQTNYSSARQGLLEDQKTYGRLQQFLIEHLCQEVFETWLISAVTAGEVSISPTEFWKDKDSYLKHRWITPGWSWIDPLKEMKANESALANGLDTRTRIAASQGRDWEEDIQQLAEENKLMESLGLPTAAPIGGNVNAQSQTDGTGQTDDGTTGTQSTDS